MIAHAAPPMPAASWIGLLDLHERLADSWTLIGGQALVGKAAALSNAGDPGLGRLRRDFVRTPVAIRLPRQIVRIGLRHRCTSPGGSCGTSGRPQAGWPATVPLEVPQMEQALHGGSVFFRRLPSTLPLPWHESQAACLTEPEPMTPRPDLGAHADLQHRCDGCVAMLHHFL